MFGDVGRIAGLRGTMNNSSVENNVSGIIDDAQLIADLADDIGRGRAAGWRLRHIITVAFFHSGDSEPRVWSPEADDAEDAAAAVLGIADTITEVANDLVAEVSDTRPGRGGNPAGTFLEIRTLALAALDLAEPGWREAYVCPQCSTEEEAEDGLSTTLDAMEHAGQIAELAREVMNGAPAYDRLDQIRSLAADAVAPWEADHPGPFAEDDPCPCGCLQEPEDFQLPDPTCPCGCLMHEVRLLRAAVEDILAGRFSDLCRCGCLDTALEHVLTVGARDGGSHLQREGGRR